MPWQDMHDVCWQQGFSTQGLTPAVYVVRNLKRAPHAGCWFSEGACRAERRRHNTPNTPATMAKSMMVVPLPTRAYIGPGQAPVMAQPNPNAVPPSTLTTRRFVLQLNHVAFDAFHFECANEPNAQRTDADSAADDAVHVEALKGKHFLDSEPREHFCFDENQAKQRAQNQCDDVFHGDAFKQE